MMITRDEWLSAFQQAMQGASPEDGVTSGEIVSALGLHDDRRVRRMLKQLIANGQAEHVMVRRTMINGVSRFVPAYRLKKSSVQ